MRAFRVVAVVLLVLAGLLVAADFGTRAWAQSRVASTLQAELDLSRRPDVGLGGFPFLPRAVAGRLAMATLSGADLSAGDLPLERVEVSVPDVRFSLVPLLAGRDTTIRTGRATGTAVLTGEGVTKALKAAGLDVRVRLAGGRARLGAPGIPLEVPAKVSVDGGVLILRPTAAVGLLTVRLDLGELVPGVRFTDGRIEGSLAMLSFTLEHRTFRI